jgi:thiol-disulfide isomerase/thioredoxin
MPRPPILPLIDWPAIFATARTFEQWLANAESLAQREKIQTERQNLALGPPLASYLAALPRPVHVLAIAEDWCGDVVRHVPVLQLLAEAAPNLVVRYIGREQYPDLFARYLTNGGESIPVFVFLNADFVECGRWGPLPENCRELLARGKACGDLKTARERISALYDADPRRREVIRELVRLIDIASTLAL